MARSLVELVLDPAHDPNRLALVGQDGAGLTHAELAAVVAERRDRLVELGVGPGTPVALYADDRIDLPIAYLAVIAAGGAVVPVNSRFGPGELHDAARTLGDALWLTCPGRRELLVGALVEWGGPCRVHHIESLEQIERRAADGATLPVLPVPDEPGNPLDVVAFTSGTTGIPKGACLRRSALEVALASSGVSYRFTPDTVLLYSAAMAFVPTVLTQILGTLAKGGTVHILQSRDPEAWLDQAEATGATFTYVPTPELASFTAAAERRAGAPGFEAIFHAGSAAHPDVLEHALAVFGDRMLEAWGMTETCGAPITVSAPGDLATLGPARFARSVGRAVPEAVVTLDTAQGEGQGDGELLVAAEFLCHGYLDLDGFHPIDRTAFPTGDLGTIDDGYVAITGRRKELIISGGINISPVEVELCIASLDGVAEAAVFGVDDARWGEAVSVAVVPEPGAEIDAEAVIAHVKTRLASFKAPKHVHVVTELPRTPSQKVMRHALRARFTTNDHQEQGATDA